MPKPILSSFGRRSPHNAVQVAAIKAWARAALQLDEDTICMVTELQCTEAGCPPLETVIAVLTTPGAPQQYKISKALGDVTAADVRSLLTLTPHQHQHP